MYQIGRDATATPGICINTASGPRGERKSPQK
jgi:hypothetical protein